MSDDLSFISLETSPDVSSKVSSSVDANIGERRQAHDFKKVLEDQMAGRGARSQNPQTGKVAEDSGLKKVNEEREESKTGALAAEAGHSVEEMEENFGKTLPSLTVHDRALEVGRVILTTAKTMVDENSLNEFVRKQVQSGKTPIDEMHSASARAQLENHHMFNPTVRGRSFEINSMNGIAPRQSNNGDLSKSIDFRLARGTVSLGSDHDPSAIGPPSARKEGFGGKADKLRFGQLANPLQVKGGGSGSADIQSNSENVDRVFADNKQSLRSVTQGHTKDTELLRNDRLAIRGGEARNASDFIWDKSIRLEGQESGKTKSLGELKEAFGSKRREDFETLKVLGVNNKSKNVDAPKYLQMNEVVKMGHEAGLSESSNFDVSEMMGNDISVPKKFGATAMIPESTQDHDPRVRAVSRESVSLGELLTSKADVRDNFLRSEQYSNWSKRFGEILGQRLSVAINKGSWNVKLNLHPSSLGHIDITLDIGDKGIEGQINTADPAARQLLQDSLPKLRATLAELYDQGEAINLSLGDKEKSGSDSQKPDNSIEVAIDLLAEEFAVEDGQAVTLNGLDLFV